VDHVLNVTCHVKVYDYLHGLFCHAQLVIIRCRGNTSERCLVSLRELEQVRQHKIKFYLNIVIFSGKESISQKFTNSFIKCSNVFNLNHVTCILNFF